MPSPALTSWDPTNQHRVACQHEIEKGISEWTKRRTVEEVVRVMMQAGVPVGRVNSVKEVLGNEQVVARGAVREVKVGSKGKEEEGWNVKMQGTFPVVDGVDPQPVWAGPDLGAHTDLVLSEELELTRGEIERLRKDGVIG